MTPSPVSTPSRLSRTWLAAAATIAAFLAGCATPLPPAPPPVAMPQPEPAPAPVAETPAAVEPAFIGAISRAQTPREYRTDAANHLYSKNSARIFKGKLPPLLYAVGVLQVDVDTKGMVTRLNWMRAPSHVPDVMAEIERTVRNAAPYPVAVQLGHVTYTDTWLWDRSGRFQLDTLTEGQLGEMPTRSSKAEAQAVKEASRTAPGKTAKTKSETKLASGKCRQSANGTHC